MTMNPSDPTPARLPLEERRRRILETAVQVYSQHGFHQTGMRQLCAALGMSPGALYRYFPGKEAIIAGLVEMDRDMIQHNLRGLPPDLGFVGTLHHMMDVTMGVRNLFRSHAESGRRGAALHSLSIHRKPDRRPGGRGTEARRIAPRAGSGGHRPFHHGFA